MTKNETGLEVIEAKLAELYELQRERIEELVTKMLAPSPKTIREEVAEAREILGEWMWCLEAKDRASRRVEGKAKLETLAALEGLYRIQKARIKALHMLRGNENVEASLKTEINRARSMLDDIAKLQVNMGILEG